MDRLGGTDESRDDGFCDRDDAPDPLPPAIGQAERRMQVRAYNFWASLLGVGPFPPVERLLKGFYPDFAEHSVLLHFQPGSNDPEIAFLGNALAGECGASDRIVRLSDVPERSVLSRITDHCQQIIANQAPIGFEAEFVNQLGRVILYRGILLPFSTDNRTIDHIYGVINWKEVADRQVVEDLHREIGMALEETAAIRRPAEIVAIFADGPAGFAATDDPVCVIDPTPECPATPVDPVPAARALATSLRSLTSRPLAALPGVGAEFALVMVRRRPDGEIVYLGEIADDPALMERAARRILH